MIMDIKIKDRIKKDIIDFFDSGYDGVSFAELDKRIDGFKKSTSEIRRAIALSLEDSDKETNIVIWDGMTEEGVEALQELQKEGFFKYKPCSILIYLVDGMQLAYPIAKKIKHYKKIHWIPVVLNRNNGKKPKPELIREEMKRIFKEE
jgi:hypothetical protein